MLKTPGLILLDDYRGNWEDYLSALYSLFKEDFIDSYPLFDSKRVGINKHPIINAKEATFWHVISDGDIEQERIPDLRRCERIKWIRFIIENHSSSEIKIWENQRGNSTRICLCLGEWDYVVVLLKKKDYILLLTSYPVERQHRKIKMEKEYLAYIKAKSVV